MTKQLEALIAEMKAAAEKATPGQWVYLPKNTSIEYDVGSDDSQGSIVYMDSGDFTQQITDLNGAHVAAANPENVLALIAALEQSQRANSAQDDHINQQQDRIEQLEKGHQEAAKQIQSWRRLAKQNIAEREKDIAELDAARKRIAELEAALFKAETKGNEFADEIFSLKLNELNASPLAVKLPATATTFDAAAAIRACMDEFPLAVQDVVEECAVIAENTIRAAGGTVEGD